MTLSALAALPDRFRAVGMFHGGGMVTDQPDSPHLVISNVTAELVAGLADQDRSMPPDAIATFEAALALHRVGGFVLARAELATDRGLPRPT